MFTKPHLWTIRKWQECKYPWGNDQIRKSWSIQATEHQAAIKRDDENLCWHGNISATYFFLIGEKADYKQQDQNDLIYLKWDACVGVSIHQGTSGGVVSKIRGCPFKRIRSSAGGATVIGQFVFHLKRLLRLICSLSLAHGTWYCQIFPFFQEKLKMWASIWKCLVCKCWGESMQVK